MISFRAAAASQLGVRTARFRYSIASLLFIALSATLISSSSRFTNNAKFAVLVRTPDPLPWTSAVATPQSIGNTANVIWTNAVGVLVSGNSLSKTAATAWGNAGAASTQTLPSGDGYVEFTASEVSTYRMCGLSRSDVDQNYTSIDFAMYPTGTGSGSHIYVYESGVYRGDFGAYVSGDRLRVAITGGVVKYSRNGTVFYSSTVAPSYPLRADASLHDQNGTITNAIISSNTIADDFNDNVLDTSTWDKNNLFSGYTDTTVPIAETLQRLEIGPLPQNTGETNGTTHYRGVRTVNTYNFTDAYSYVELAQAAPATTKADAMFTVGNSVENYYRLYVSGGNLIGQRKMGGAKGTLFTIPYDTTNHRFLRIRHDAATGNLTLDTATGSGGVPGSWVQRYSEAWNSSISLTGIIFEMKAGTWQPETNVPGKVIFDNFEVGSNSTAPANPLTVTAISPNSGSANGGTSVAITGTGFSSGATVSFGGSVATNVTVASSTSITATTPAHAAGAVNVVVTRTDGQNGSLPNGYTYNSPPASPPTITAISPNSGSINGGTSVTITGTGFSSGATVSFGGSVATNVTVASSTSITANTPAGKAGAVNVVVTRTDGQNGSLTNGYTYNSDSSSETLLIADDFNDNVVDTAKWDKNNLFSGFTDASVAINETLQRLEIGPLPQNTGQTDGTTHYRGVRTVNTYNFSGAYSYVELAQAASSTTKGDAMFTIGNNVDNYYRLYVSNGNLIGLRKVGGAKATLFTIPYDTTNHRFLRILHDAAKGTVTLDTATGSGGVPGSWVQRYSEAWNSSISLTSIIFELKGGTWQAEANVPGKVIFDNFKAAVSNSGDSANFVSGGSAPTIERLDPMNRTGGGSENPLSRNFNWTLPLLSLPGRAGLDLNLSLSYNSLVWLKSGGNGMTFDDDGGFPGPGFRLGFPVIKPTYFNSQAGKNAFLVISPDGSRTELRQVGTSQFYEAGDSSYLMLDSSNMILYTADGSQLRYSFLGQEFACTEIKDRNGNFITISYTPANRIDTIIDTLGRNIKFNYVAGLLTDITQTWSPNVTHYWARFEYTDTTIHVNFPGLTVSGTTEGAIVKTLSRLRLADGSRYDFNSTSWGQVWQLRAFAPDGHLLNYRAYNLPTKVDVSYTDCPRFTERHDWAQYWNGDTDGTEPVPPTGVEEEVVTKFAEPVSAGWTMPDGTFQSGMLAQVTMPDGTSDNVYFIGETVIVTVGPCPKNPGTFCTTTKRIGGWRRGFPALVNTYDGGGALQRQVMTTWMQVNTDASYPDNPRATEKNVYDPSNNRRRTTIGYQTFTLPSGSSCSLPNDIAEFGTDGAVLRRTQTTFETSMAYLNATRRLIGLPTLSTVSDGAGNLVSKQSFQYDQTGEYLVDQGTTSQHDGAKYGVVFIAGRGNLAVARQFDVTDPDNNLLTHDTHIGYNTNGSVVFKRDAASHTVNIDYVDSFSDGVTTRKTFAYPTTVTDPDKNSTTSIYNFDFGEATQLQTPLPNQPGYQPGPKQTFTYDGLGRLEKISNSVNAAYTRFDYTLSPTRIDTYTTIEEGKGEAHSFTIADGLGRVIATAKEHPTSITDHPETAGGFSGQQMVYDMMGRVIKTSNPTETHAVGAPSQWDAVGDDSKWIYTKQTYDWKGRPLVTTNQDVTSKSASYAGCGCAGGDVVTLTDEENRQQKIYSDVLGRPWKTEVYTFPDPNANPTRSVYSTTVSVYNTRDQVTNVKQYAGSASADASSTNALAECATGSCQETAMTFDGYGRLITQHRPEQRVDSTNSSSTDHTTWTYKVDGLIESVTDARGAKQTFDYDGRHHVTNIIYTASASSIAPAARVTYVYDAAGNRTSMSDGFGEQKYDYDSLSQLKTEIRPLPVGMGSFSINYSYNLGGQLSSVTDPFGASFSYTRNVQGQLTAVAGSPYAGVSSYITDVKYRAWGAPKRVFYAAGNSIIEFNLRMLPSKYTGAVGREEYSYFADGKVAQLKDLDDTSGSNPPATIRRLSRRYAYDQMGRVKEGAGLESVGLPFYQHYEYDPFGNTTKREGYYYNYGSQAFSSDTSTYTNNRRNGWTYDAEGQVGNTPATSTDQARGLKYDAAGRMVSSQTNTSTYSAKYNGDSELVFESSNTSGVTTSSYIIRSTVLGEPLTRLDSSGNKKITHVPAEGLLFATQRADATGQSVLNTQRNPLGITETFQAVYDPLGNYIPFQKGTDPRPPAGSFSSASMSGLSSSQADPNSLAVGCIMDGLPTSCTRVMNAINRGQAKEVTLGGTQNPNVVLANAGIITQVKTQTVELAPYDPNDPANDNIDDVEVIEGVSVPGGQKGFDQNRVHFHHPQQNQQKESEVNAQQNTFDDCVRRNMRTFRRAEYPAIGKIAFGTVGTFLGFRTAIFAGAKLVEILNVPVGVKIIGWTPAGRLLQAFTFGSAFVSVFSGEMLVQGFKDSHQNSVIKDEAVENCKKSSPNADHSVLRIAKIAATTW